MYAIIRQYHHACVCIYIYISSVYVYIKYIYIKYIVQSTDTCSLISVSWYNLDMAWQLYFIYIYIYFEQCFAG